MFVKAKYIKNDAPCGRGYTFKAPDGTNVGDLMTDPRGSKLMVIDDPVDMEWVRTYGDDKIVSLEKYQEEQ